MKVAVRHVAAALLTLGVGFAIWWGTNAGAKRSCLDRQAPAPDGAYVEADLSEPGRVVLRYADGEERHFARGPERIVSTLPGLSEVVAWLGAESRLVAVSEHADFPPSLADLPVVGVYPPDIEGILGHRPEVVLVDRDLFRSQLDDLSRRIEGLLPLESSRSLAHLERSIFAVAAVLGTPEAAARAEAFRARKAALLAEIRQERPAQPFRVLLVGQWDPVYVLGPDALLSDLVRICGGINAACDLDLASNTFDEELVLARAPDWILHEGAEMPDTLRARWRDVPAVKQGRLASYDANDLVRAGPRILDGLERLRAVLLRGRDPATLDDEGERAP